MSLNLDFSQKEIKVISSRDEAVTCNKEEYQEYLKTLDEQVLRLDPAYNPTRFLLRTNLTYIQQQKIKSQQMQVEGGKVNFNVGYMMEEIRLALFGIEEVVTSLVSDEPIQLHPGRIVFKRADDGGADYELIARLENAGIVSELFTARQNSMGGSTNKVNESSKKN